MRQIILVLLAVIVAVSAVVLGFTFNQATEERLTLTADLQYRTRLLADSLIESVEPYYIGKGAVALQKLINKFADREHLVGLAVYDSRGTAVATSTGFSQRILENTPIIGAVLDSDKPSGVFTTVDNERVYIFVEPLRDSGRVVGAFLVAQSARYIDGSVSEIWKNNLIRLFIQLFLFSLAVFFLVRFVFLRSVRRLAESVKTARIGGGNRARETVSESGFFQPLTAEISKMTVSLRAARSVASEEARMRLEKLDSPWTAERLKEFIKAYLKDRKIFLAFNREPYTHNRVKNEIRISSPAGGASTALEPIMEACGGMWFAHGNGNADKEVVDKNDTIAVPPDNPKYTLKRLWLTEGEIKGFYRGFSTEGLLPLCLMTHTRPIFRKEDWFMYRRVNGKYAKTILDEIKNVQRPIILMHDYHLALLPRFIKKSRPDAQIGLFWHIPWPSPEAFSICPWRKEILEGMLGADVVGFNTQQFCNNFIDTVSKELESLVDLERFAITRDAHTSYIRSFPISIAFTNSQEGKEGAPADRTAVKRLGIETPYLGLGVDRLDYTKGIPERFRGVEYFLEAHPEYRRRFTFLQIASPTRQEVKRYQEYRAAVIAEAERINKKWGTREWKPIVLEITQYNHQELEPLYKLANVCLVTSLHDSMNLVAKEYAAARSDERGVLVLSQFAGASRDLKGALIINPYNTEEVGSAIHQALIMSHHEQWQRMKKMREAVRNYNIYRWAAELIKAVAEVG